MGSVKIHKKVTQVTTCITRDKITRYRGILKLHARDKKLQLSQATKFKSTTSRKLASLGVDVRNQRRVIKDLSEDGTLRLLEKHRKFYLTYKQLQPSEIYAAIYQDNDVNRRLLDKLYYKRKRKLEHAIELQLKCSYLSTECGEEDELHCNQQQLVVRLQRYISKYNAAKTIHSTYLSMLNILRKDAIFFDTLLNILKEDQVSQCKTILRMTVMGQLTAENLDDVRQKCKRMTRVILHNMKIREQTMNNVRFQVQDLWAYTLSLVRVESDTVFMKKDDESSSDKILEKQLVHLKGICNQVKETLLVRSYYDLFSRFNDQSKQQTNLLAKLNAIIKNRDTLLSKTNYAVQVFEGLKYSKTEQHKAHRCEMLELIETEEKREEDFKKQKETYGELLTNIRAALQYMNTMLLHIKQPVAAKSVKKIGKDVGKDVLKESSDKEDTDELELLAEFEEIDADVLVLLGKVTRKINILFNMSNFDFEKEKQDAAKNLYQNYVSNYSSNLIFGSGEEEPIELFLEHEIVDVTVPTRIDIKLQSKQITETHLKPEQLIRLF